MNVNTLPPEVLTNIFSCLTKLDLLRNTSQVCSYWNGVALCSDLWIILNLITFSDEDFDLCFQYFPRIGQFVQNLLIKSDHLMKLFSHGISCDLPNLANLQIVNYLSGNEREVCQNIVNSFPKLTSIRLRIFRSADFVGCLTVFNKIQFRDFDISISKGANEAILNQCLDQFISKQKDLRSLSIQSSDLQSQTIRKTLRHATQLQDLVLSNCSGIDSQSFDGLINPCDLSSIDLTSTNVDDNGIKNIASKAKNLKTLHILFCPKLSDVGVKYIAEHCTRLENLQIYNIPAIGSGIQLYPETLKILGSGCSQLKHLSMVNCPKLDDTGIRNLVENCSDLKFLEVQSECISNNGLMAVSEYCKCLFHIDIHGLNFDVTTIEHLLLNHRHLHFLSVNRCENLETLNFIKNQQSLSFVEKRRSLIEKHSHVKKIEFLNSDINESSLEQLVVFCPDLRSISCSGNQMLDQKEKIENIFIKSRFLKKLNLGGHVFQRKDFIYKRK
ncbi:uncharacterized protein LOC127728463 [Mytilus californianus]|uniref:uncharacterized protein LOC127728463 n=1 Tax=Mytilus californianus TaxID=6549 RepID=UPI002246AC29|nr:uncharacterized protein LOC127728463 [Mytilus californianus]